MANNKPFDRLIGPLTIYIAPVGEAVPAVNATPAGNWVVLGPTDGEQSLQHAGEATFLRDNDHTGPVKAVRPEEDVLYNFVLVGLTLENYGRIISAVSKVASAVGPPATKTLPLKRGYYASEYALIAKGAVLSPYGQFPGMYVIPRGIFDGEPEPMFTKDEGASLEVNFHSLEDDTQGDPDKSLGWLVVQTA